MKKFYAFAAAAVAALSMNAQSLYLVGNGEGLAWDPSDPMEVTLEGDAYTFDINNLVAFKMSTVKAASANEWDAYNAAALYASITEENLGTPVALELNGDSNITTPWPGNYHVVVAADLSTITMTTDSEKPQTEIFVRGDMNEWGAPEAWKFSTEDGVHYTFVCDGETAIEPGVEFKIADANWGNINYSAGGVVTINEEMYWNYDDQVNSTVEETFEGTIFVTLPEEAHAELTVTFTDKNGVDAIETVNGEAEYFNLQGVRVANPENGLYIVRQNGKVSKQVIR